MHGTIGVHTPIKHACYHWLRSSIPFVQHPKPDLNKKNEELQPDEQCHGLQQGLQRPAMVDIVKMNDAMVDTG